MVERLFLAVPRGSLQFVIVVFPDHTHLLFLFLFLCRVLSFQVVPIVCVGFCVSRSVFKDYVVVYCSSYCLCRVLWFQVVPIVCVGFCGSRLFCYALFGVLSTFAIILRRKIELVALLCLPYVL